MSKKVNNLKLQLRACELKIEQIQLHLEQVKDKRKRLNEEEALLVKKLKDLSDIKENYLNLIQQELKKN